MWLSSGFFPCRWMIASGDGGDGIGVGVGVRIGDVDCVVLNLVFRC